MAKNTSFALGDHFASFVESKITEGRFASASDVVRAGLRLLEEEEAVPFDFEAFIAQKRSEASAS